MICRKSGRTAAADIVIAAVTEAAIEDEIAAATGDATEIGAGIAAEIAAATVARHATATAAATAAATCRFGYRPFGVMWSRHHFLSFDSQCRVRSRAKERKLRRAVALQSGPPVPLVHGMSTLPPPTSAQYTELAELAGGLIHEVKNHLGTLTLNLQLLAEDLDQPETPRERRALQRVQRLKSECDRLTNLSNDFLRFARLRELVLVPTNLKQVIDELVIFYAPSARQANIEVKTFLPADLPPVLLDRDLFSQALLNLVLNATQAMPRGGELTIQAEPQDKHVCLDLIDTGIGIPDDVRTQIFRPFYTTRKGGSGLGLPTTLRIMEAHGGSIDVQSEPGKGTKFTLRLPVASGTG
jgi:signal transduction histidine kinase